MNESILSNANYTLSDPTTSRRKLYSQRSIKSSKIIKLTFFIGGFNGGPIVDSILNKRGWRRIYDPSSDDYTLRWTEQLSQINFYNLKSNLHLVNHIPNNGILTNKLGMLLSLRSYEKYCASQKRINQFSMDDFIPKTYIVDDLKERNNFFNEFKGGDIWIKKPAGANQGKGITLIRSLDKFKTELLDREYFSKTMMWKYDTHIIQRYISNPMLIEGRKFDIRCFMLIASTIPYLVLFHPGYIRLSINQYSNDDDDLITHLTNQFIQKQSPKYNDVKDSTIWKIENFNEYFNASYRKSEYFKENWVKNDLMDNLKGIMLHLFKAVKQQLSNNTSYFELYGLDFIVDSSMKVWLIEVNSNPSMSLNCEILKTFIPLLVDETLCIALECFEKNTKLNTPLVPLNTLKKFEIIYSEDYEIAKTRKPINSSFKIWSAPRYTDSKSFSECSWTGQSTIPFHLRLSAPYRESLHDTYTQWKVNTDRNQMSMPNIKKSIRQVSEASPTQLKRYSPLSGDIKSFKKDYNTDSSILINNVSVGRLSKSLKTVNYRETNSASVTQNKLRELLKNLR